MDEKLTEVILKKKIGCGIHQFCTYIERLLTASRGLADVP
jgi:hypothetical protein